MSQGGLWIISNTQLSPSAIMKIPQSQFLIDMVKLLRVYGGCLGVERR